MNDPNLSLSVLPGVYTIARLGKDEPIPSWVREDGPLCSITRTADELSIVCSQEIVPSSVTAEKGWCAFKVEGPLDLSLTGITSSLAVPLSEASINLFALSTYDTDYILVKQDRLEEAKEVLGEHFKIF